MSTLCFLNYNNYQNRILKGEAVNSVVKVDDTTYTFDGITIGKRYTGLNFDQKDGIHTMHVINDSSAFPYDYLLVLNDDSNTIKSKWFVIEAKWNMKNQWIVSLLRDLKADFYTLYYNKPFYCTKGIPSGTSDYMLYNAEGRQFNQILKSRTALKQGSNTKRWIIGFVDKTWGGGQVVYGDTVRFEKYEDIPSAGTVKYADYLAKATPLVEHPNSLKFVIKDAADKKYLCRVGFDLSNDLSNPTTSLGEFKCYTFTDVSNDAGFDDYFITSETLTSASDVKALFGATSATQKENAINVMSALTYKRIQENGQVSAYDGKIARINAGSDGILQYYLMTKVSEGLYSWDIAASPTSDLGQSFLSLSDITGYVGSPSIGTYGKYNRVYLRMTAPTFINIGVPNASLSEMPYNIFCIEDSKGAREFATAFAAQYAGGNVLYDLQLFPYEPSHGNTGTTYAAAQTGFSNDFTLYWATSDSREGTCTHAEIKTYDSLINTKIGSEQHMCRLISPNGASAWEFNPAATGKSNPSVIGVPANSIRYEFTLMPFSSYLHIFPTFDRLYGTINKAANSETAETRGLVCTGPWTLPYSTDNWATYQLQNSAYMDSFNRDIQNMTTMQDIERSKEKVNIATNAIQAGVSGAMTGAIATGGNPYGAAAVGMSSALASALGGEADRMYNDMAREEQLNYTKDQFYNSLRNIQAQARPLASTSSITVGNSWFPIIEYYTATTQEETILTNDLTVHGWTMGFKTTFETMKNRATLSANSRYIRGHLLQVGLGEDSHIATEIMKELDKGVYICQI